MSEFLTAFLIGLCCSLVGGMGIALYLDAKWRRAEREHLDEMRRHIALADAMRRLQSDRDGA